MLVDVAVEQVSVAAATECDACFGQQECVGFTLGPDENPLFWDIHYTNYQCVHNPYLLQRGFV